MTSTKTLSLSATMAIAAVLALGSNPATAQSVTPDATAPAAPAPVAAPAPTIVLPAETTTAPTAVSSPVVEVPKAAAPVAEAAIAAPVVSRSPVRSAAPAKAAPAKSASVVATPAVTPVAQPPIESSGRSAPLAPVPPSGPSTAQVSSSAATPPATTRTSSNNPETAWEIGLAALVGIGLAGGIGLTLANARANARRRRESLTVEHVAYGDAVASPTPAEPEVAQPAVIEAPVEHPLHQPFASRFSPAPAMTFSPAGPVPKGDAREELIARMVEAEPDAENPFTSTKSRRRRARMILSRREVEQRRSATEPFDWRTYRDLPQDELSQREPRTGEPGVHKTPVPASA